MHKQSVSDKTRDFVLNNNDYNINTNIYKIWNESRLIFLISNRLGATLT